MTWILIYIVSACWSAGIVSFLMRQEMKENGSVSLSVKEAILIAFFTLTPIVNTFVAVFGSWFCIDTFGSAKIITFGKKEQE